MKVAIIGSGFTGLAAGRELFRKGHQVTIFEKEDHIGGLASGFQDPVWEWPLEKHYHHIFTSDRSIQSLGPFTFSRPITATSTPSGIYQLDSPLSLLKFPDLSFFDRIRTGIVLGVLRYLPVKNLLANITARDFLIRTMGQQSWDILWKPLFTGKFAKRSGDISAVWFWARIVKRSSYLGYPDGGFAGLTNILKQQLETNEVQFYLNTPVSSIKKSGNQIEIQTESGNKFLFDKVICTLPSEIYAKLTGNEIVSSKMIGAINLILALKKPFLPSNIYWLNINRPGMPFLALVEHTNFVSASHYGGDHLLYIGNYLPPDHKYFGLNSDQLLREYLPGLIKINPVFTPDLIRKSWIWKDSYAQPIVDTDYAKNIPDMLTPIPGLILANMQQVYPWDRGTNYAVELGQKAAALCLNS